MVGVSSIKVASLPETVIGLSLIHVAQLVVVAGAWNFAWPEQPVEGLPLLNSTTTLWCLVEDFDRYVQL